MRRLQITTYSSRADEHPTGIAVGGPLVTEVRVGAQTFQEQFDRILRDIKIGQEEGGKVLMAP